MLSAIETVIAKKITKLLKKAGLETQYKDTYHRDHERASGLVSQGLPDHVVRISPEYIPLYGALTICISPTAVFFCKIPVTDEASMWWNIEAAANYNSPTEMVEIVKKMYERNLGCWVS